MRQPLHKLVSSDSNVFYILLAALLVDRLLVLLNFGFVYTGTDDLIYWHGANDYANGVFHEPYFYGQDYNFMLEALLAVPLVWLSVPFQYALPLCSTLISLFPFVLFALVLFKNGYRTESFMFLLIPLALPVEYGMLNTMTRGFVSGLFFSGFLVFPLLRPTVERSWLIGALSLGLGYLFNPNSVIAALPVCLYMWFVNYKRPFYYVFSLLSLAPVWCVWFFAREYYQIRPEVNVHPQWQLEFSVARLAKNMESLDNFFCYFMPFFWVMAWVILPVVLASAYFIFKTDRLRAVCLAVTVCFIVLSLGINKVNDSVNSLFYSSARMYMGIPMVAALAFFWLKKPISSVNLKFILLLSGVCACCLKAGLLKTIIRYETFKTNYGSVAIKKVEELRRECAELKEIAVKHRVDLIVFVPNSIENPPSMELYDYGAPLLEKNMPSTVLNTHERRSWIFSDAKIPKRRNILLYGAYFGNTQLGEFPNATPLPAGPGQSMVLFKDFNGGLDSLLNRLGVTCGG